MSPDRTPPVTSISSMFHEPWWLSAVTADRYEEVIVERGGKRVGRLPYVADRRGPFLISRMPLFTHLLGPLVDAGKGKPQTRMVRRLSITRELINQLPPFLYFEQTFDPGIDDGLATADGLAFQEHGFSVAPQYTFEIDCRVGLEELWNGMHFKTRQHVRRAEESYSPRTVEDSAVFIDNYLKNTRALGRDNWLNFKNFPALYAACRSRQRGEILGAFSADGSSAAFVYLVWDDRTMYYLLSTRAPDPSDHGSVSLLIWTAMKLAHQRGLTFDLDGVYSSGAARFLSGFGGQIKTRLLVKRSSVLFTGYEYLKLKKFRKAKNRNIS